MLDSLKASPTAVRVVPFVLFVGLTALQGKLFPHSQYWLYLLKTVLVGWMLWTVRKDVPEMRWRFSFWSLLAGVGVFVLWVGLDPFYPHLSSKPSIWRPLDDFSSRPMLAWFFIGVRLIGSVLVVPFMEEVFFRSFIYRSIAARDFLSIPLNHFHLAAFIATAAAFGFEHNEWLPGILCGLIYHWLILRSNQLGEAISAHALTNLLLGLWVVGKGAWQFW